MKVNWKSFKSDRYFFLKYFFIQMASSIGLGIAAYLAYGFPKIGLWWSPFLVIGALLAIVLGIQLPAMLHNAVHFNIKPRWLNEVLGEVGGFLVLFGLGPFRISHFMHHAFADSEKDPHPPQDHSFLHFLATTQLNTIKVIREQYLIFHGQTLQNQSILLTELAFYYVNLIARIAFLFMALGPTLFVWMYLPAYITNVLVFAHINYATHEKQADGNVKIINLNKTWYHKLVNAIGSGVYFHKNHHERPNLYNPQKRVN